jgi:glycosyltransferase involved in cell wall biosynthesis
MPKVLQIVNRFNLGGLIFTSAYLTKYLAPEYETLLIGGEKDDSEESSLYIMEQLGVKPIVLPELKREINFKNDRLAYKKIRQIIRDFKPDIVHTHASKSGAIGRLAAYHEKVPVIIHTFHGHVFHSYFGFLKTLFYKLIERYLAKISTKIIAISPAQKIELTTQFKISSEAKTDVIPYGFDLQKFTENIEYKRSAFRSKYKIADDKIVVGTIGRLVPIKNHFLFIDIIKELQKRSPGKYIGMIIGDGESREEILQYIRSQCIDFVYQEHKCADMILTSWIKQVDEVYAGLDFALITSLNEGTPVSLIEAQASGTYVLSTNVGGVQDVLIEGKTGSIFSSFTKDEFVEKIISLNQFRPQQEFTDIIIERFGYQQMVEKTRVLYENERANLIK